MPEVTKNEVIIAALKSAGYQQITLKVVPKIFYFTQGPNLLELEFARSYFDDITLPSLKGLMRDVVLPALKEQIGKKVYVNADGIRIASRSDEHKR
jgi:hypothetical protein